MPADQIIIRYPLLQEAVQRNEGRWLEAVHDAVEKAAPEDQIEQALLVASFNNAYGALAEHDTGTTVMAAAQNALASRIQTAIVDQARETGKLQLVRPRESIVTGAGVVELARLLEVKFDSTDIFPWIWMSRLILFPPKPAPWLAPPTIADDLDAKAIVAVFGDWGTGLYGAPFIARQIQVMPRCDVALHLGDTYYCGSDDEISSRLVNAWPVRANTVHRTLNGNHEMYSGGVGYFKALQQVLFNQTSSCFAMQNDNWLLLGLDTSYHEASIDQAQADWVTTMANGAGARKVLLFSHHQVYSKIENASTGENLRTMLGPVLTQGKIYGWFFGHEHRLVVFDPNPAWGGMKARCMGHGGFPEFRKSLPGAEPDTTQWIRLDKTNTVPAAEIFDGKNEFIRDSPSDPEKYVPHGYLVLEFDGPTLYETYFDPSGAVTRERVAL